MKKILNIESSVEATNWELILVENNIPHVIRPLKDTIYGGALSMNKPYAELLAPAEYHDQILELKNEVIPKNLAGDSKNFKISAKEIGWLMVVIVLTILIFLNQIKQP